MPDTTVCPRCKHFVGVTNAHLHDHFVSPDGSKSMDAAQQPPEGWVLCPESNRPARQPQLGEGECPDVDICEYPKCGRTAQHYIGTDGSAVCEAHRTWSDSSLRLESPQPVSGEVAVHCPENIAAHRAEATQAERERIVVYLRSIDHKNDRGETTGFFSGDAIANMIEAGDHA